MKTRVKKVNHRKRKKHFSLFSIFFNDSIPNCCFFRSLFKLLFTYSLVLRSYIFFYWRSVERRTQSDIFVSSLRAYDAFGESECTTQRSTCVRKLSRTWYLRLMFGRRLSSCDSQFSISLMRKRQHQHPTEWRSGVQVRKHNKAQHD